MKVLRVSIFVVFCFILFSCKKSKPAPTMSASINGSSSIIFSASSVNNNGVTVITGTSSNSTITLNISLTGTGIYILSYPSTSSYATVTKGSVTYTTAATSTGQAAVTLNTITGLYSGTFYFNALNNGNSVIITNGQFTNL